MYVQRDLVYRESIIIIIALNLLRQSEQEEILCRLLMLTLGADSGLQGREETVFKGGKVSLDVIHHGHREHAVHEAVGLVEGQLCRGGQLPHGIDSCIIRTSVQDFAVIPDGLQILQIFAHSIPVQLLFFDDFIAEVGIKFVHQLRYGQGPQIAVIRLG